MKGKLKRSSLKCLHLIHIISISIWFGSVISISALSFIVFSQASETIFFTLAPLIPWLYKTIVLPIALFTIIQGIIYGLFTNWGFFKHKWITYKWCLLILVSLSTGMGTIAPIFTLLEKANTHGFVGGFAESGSIPFFLLLQITLLLLMIILSVFKPKKTNKALNSGKK
ncbi:MAG TPA: hypothetical protein VFD02_04740 [Syntrophomonadaceae bacterium]|nr:hypothetical protein [Syntrophomonadaceae bacterium]